MSQDNTLQSLALADLRLALDEIGIFREISGTIKGPEEVSVYPCAYYALGDELESQFKDIQHVHYETISSFLVVVYVHETETKGIVGRESDLALMLAKTIQLVKDKINEYRVDEFRTHGYEQRDPPFQVETDNGALAMTGSPIAMAAITIRLYFPPADAS